MDWSKTFISNIFPFFKPDITKALIKMAQDKEKMETLKKNIQSGCVLSGTFLEETTNCLKILTEEELNNIDKKLFGKGKKYYSFRDELPKKSRKIKKW